MPIFHKTHWNKFMNFIKKGTWLKTLFDFFDKEPFIIKTNYDYILRRNVLSKHLNKRHSSKLK